MRTPLTAALVLLTLTACGEDTSTNAENPGQERRVEAPGSLPAIMAKAAVEAPATTVKAPTPMPEPADPVIVFESEDGRLALGRKALTMVSPVHDADSDVWSVFVQLDKKPAADFYILTSETAGEALSVVIDGQTVSTPILETAVYGGGFVFRVDDGEAASRVVAALKGEAPQPTIIDIVAGDVLPKDDDPATNTALTALPEDS